MSACDHSPPPDSAFAWSLWARCVCGEVEYRQGETKEARLVVISEAHYDGLRATDGTPLDSRRKHRDYMRANGVTLSDDFKETWAAQQRDREAYRRGEKKIPGLREAIGRALHRMETKRK